jgi:hypothetical protein
MKNDLDNLQNAAELTLGTDFLRLDHATIPHGEEFGMISAFPSNLKNLTQPHFRRRLPVKTLPGHPEVLSGNLLYRICQIPARENHLLIFNIGME